MGIKQDNFHCHYYDTQGEGFFQTPGASIDSLGTRSKCANLPPIVDSLPTLEILSKLQNLLNLSDYDIDENIDSDINCNNYNVPELHSLETSSKDLSILHINTRTLSLNFDELLALLGNIDF